jgi:hypothetical protein
MGFQPATIAAWDLVTGGGGRCANTNPPRHTPEGRYFVA